MKYLVIYAHPNDLSLSASFKNKIVHTLKEQECEVHEVDLYRENFYPILNSEDFIALNQGLVLNDVQKYQELIKDYKNLILIFPLWWLGFPAILKGFIDRVFSYNFAYASDENGMPYGLLESIKCTLVITMGSTIDDYKQTGLYDALIKCLDLGIMKFCNIEIEKIFIFDNVPKQSEVQIKKWLSEIEQHFQKNN